MRFWVIATCVACAPFTPPPQPTADQETTHSERVLERADLEHRKGERMLRDVDIESAELAFRSALRDREAELGSDDPLVVDSLVGLATALSRRCHSKEARALLTRAESVARNAQPRDEGLLTRIAFGWLGIADLTSDWQSARQRLDEIEARCNAIDDATCSAALFNRALIEELAGEIGAAIIAHDRARAWLRRHPKLEQRTGAQISLELDHLYALSGREDDRSKLQKAQGIVSTEAGAPWPDRPGPQPALCTHPFAHDELADLVQSSRSLWEAVRACYELGRSPGAPRALLAHLAVRSDGTISATRCAGIGTTNDVLACCAAVGPNERLPAIEAGLRVTHVDFP